ncbi:uncharacterized protein KD926_001109 [Aspergillus affinis]|uniref:uncharacterized protein n=1 Tax=Aspergillus affinis TaxID=1070780 RepID=UPI0022FEFFA6|nr:uncharacterized protein KD926_001109 [Aspergillus affinis]KAI9037011.1 hypothetical protein KD926_001109 [Aspergillus affinis]
MVTVEISHVQGVRVHWITSRISVPVTDVRALLNPVRVPEHEYPGALFPGTERYEAPEEEKPVMRFKQVDPLPGQEKRYPTYHWPGGIPSCVQKFPLLGLTEEQRDEGEDDFLEGHTLVEEARGWLLFVRENWIPREKAGITEDEDEDYELRQRRDLVERWALAEQSFRDFFHYRAAPRKSAIDYPEACLHRIETRRHQFGEFICLADIDTPEKRARFVKILILTYQLDGETMHPFGDEVIPTMVQPNPASFPDPKTFSIDDFMMWAFVENADFTSMTMSRSGHVLFRYGMMGHKFIDQNTIDTGRISMVEFKTNGMVDKTAMRLPFNIFQAMSYVNGLGWGVERLEEQMAGGNESSNGPLDFDLPVLDILESGFENEYLSFEGGVETWAEDIEKYAPGYLALEKEGKAAEYDIRNLIPEP